MQTHQDKQAINLCDSAALHEHSQATPHPAQTLLTQIQATHSAYLAQLQQAQQGFLVVSRQVQAVYLTQSRRGAEEEALNDFSVLHETRSTQCYQDQSSTNPCDCAAPREENLSLHEQMQAELRRPQPAANGTPCGNGMRC